LDIHLINDLLNLMKRVIEYLLNIFLNRFFITCLLSFLILTGCGTTDSGGSGELDISGHFENLQLTEQDIFNIDVQDDKLFAGTSDGFMVFDLESGEQTGHHKPGSNVPAFLIIDEGFWLISTAYPAGSKENAIFKSEDQGEIWVHYTNGYAEDRDHERRLTPTTMDYYLENSVPVIFARTLPVLFVARSTDGGASWENVQGNWGNPSIGAARFVKIDKNNSDIIWAGGAGSFFNAWLSKSTNGGDDWETVNILPNSENTVYDVAIRHQRSEHVLAGVGGGILKTTNSGSSWATVHTGSDTFAFTKSSRNPNIIYASGRNATGTLFFLASNDFGDTWELQEFNEGQAGLLVYDMVSVTDGEVEVLYFGTDKGVFTFRFDE